MNLLVELAKRGIDPQEVMVAGGALLLAVILLIVYVALGAKDANKRRDRLGRLRPEDVGLAAKPVVNVKRETKYSSIAALDQLIRRLFPNPAKLRERLERTGYKITLGPYLLGCLLICTLFTFAMTAVFGFPGPASLLIGIAIGVGFPHVVVGILGGRRQAKFVSLFPEAIDLIVRGLKSGLPVSEGLKVVAGEISDPVGTEFRQISDNIKFGMTLTEALWTQAKRIDMSEYRFFVISLSIQQETGGNLAETLENLSNVLRRRRQMKLKIKAFSSEAKASAYIIGSLPFLMLGIILMLNYNYGIKLFTDPRGLVMVAGALACYSIGIGIMYKMVKFEI